MKVIDSKGVTEAKFTKKDFKHISEFILDEYSRRKNSERRVSFDLSCREIDRQVRMEPDITHKLDSSGRVDLKRAWMPEMELPLQAQTLEVLTADARRMMFPDSGPWFTPHAATTDSYLEFMDSESIILGDEVDVPSIINQDNVDKLVQGALGHWHRQYDFHGHIDIINAESFKYGMGLGRGRLVQKNVFIRTSKGVVKRNKKVPVLFPISVRNTYLEDREFALMGEGQMVGPAHIFEKTQKIEDLRMSASKGSDDPDNENGGWVRSSLKGLEGDKNGDIKLVEYEGDLVASRSSGKSIFIPNTIVTVVLGEASGKVVHNVIRFRIRKKPYTSYVEFPYHREGIEDPYPTSPLMKGWPIQKAAADALNRLMMAGALNVQPPLGYNQDDLFHAQQGGLNVFPGAEWPTLDEVKVHKIGDPAALFAIYAGFLQQYADATGVNQPRLGAQTVSHTTAFAKEAELNRGVIRTVDYVRSTLKSSMAKWLAMAYDLGRDTLNKDEIYIDAYNGFVQISKKHLPELVTYDVHGAGGPAEEQAKQQAKINSLQLAMQMDQANIQLGNQPILNLEGGIREVLANGKWTDLDTIINAQSVPVGAEVQPGLGGDPRVAAAPAPEEIRALIQG